MTTPSPQPDTVTVGDSPLTIEDVCRVARGDIAARLSTDDDWRRRVESSAAYLAEKWQGEEVVYGVTTGYGDSCTVAIPPELVQELPTQLTRFHGCGMGRLLNREEGRAVLIVRLVSLACGYSGVRHELLQRLVDLLHHDIVPLIPAEGSVGASGDLTPLSYVAAVLMGEREVWHGDQHRTAAKALAEAGISPLRLLPKEGLALMNGTSVMTALACQAFVRADYLQQLVTRITAGAIVVAQGNPGHVDERLFQLKPHPGQQQVAARLRQDLGNWRPPTNTRLQDRYSLRCAPHIIGVLADALPWLRQTLEIELNSANDNPLVDGEQEAILHGGHFYGGHVALAMDTLKTAVANLADLMDRQLALLMDTSCNHGLPRNLTGVTGSRAAINHGFKAVQIATSAWTAEALKLTMPASVFSRSTECHNQDKVSLGTIAARDCLRILELTEQVAAAALLAVAQGIRLRGDAAADAPGASKLREVVEPLSPPLTEDRPLDRDLQTLVNCIRQRQWRLYD